MADAPIGISFIPNAQNQAQAPTTPSANSGTGAGSADLAQAYKILSLRLPTTVSAQAPASPGLLNSAGAGAVQNLPGGMDPYAALFQALLKSQLGIGSTGPANAGMPGLSALFSGGSAMPVSSPAQTSQSAQAPDVLSGLIGAGGAGSPGAGSTLSPKVQFTPAPRAATAPDDTGFSDGSGKPGAQQPYAY